LIPKNTKVKTQFYKGVTTADVLVGVVALGICALFAASGLPHKLYFALGALCLSALLFFTVSEERLYMDAWRLLRYLFSRKKFAASRADGGSTESLNPHERIDGDVIVGKDGGFSGVLEIKPTEFRLLSEERQNLIIDGVMTDAFCAVGAGQALNLVKLDRRLNLNRQIRHETKRMEVLITNFESGSLNEDEYRARMEIAEDRLEQLDGLNGDTVEYSGYYLVLNDQSRISLTDTLGYMRRLLLSGGVQARVLERAALRDFLRLSADAEQGESKAEIYTPQEVEFRLTQTVQNKRSLLSHFVITKYPLKVYNAWGAELFDMPDTKVVMKLTPVDKHRAVKRIDGAINELSSRNSDKASAAIDRNTHIETLSALLIKLQNDNEALARINYEFIGRRPSRIYYPTVVSEQSDTELVSRILNSKQEAKFKRLYGGDISDYPSHSNADSALVFILAWWTHDPSQIDRIFRSSGLYRDKWNSPRGNSTYGALLIGDALRYVTPRTVRQRSKQTTSFEM
jgi:hypothetical protein